MVSYSVELNQANFQPHLLIFNSLSVSIPFQLFLGSLLTAVYPFFCRCIFAYGQVFPHLKFLRCISTFTRKFSKEFLFLQKDFFSSFFYASPRWLPFLSVTNDINLERLYGADSRAMIECFWSSPISLLLFEASLPL